MWKCPFSSPSLSQKYHCARRPSGLRFIIFHEVFDLRVLSEILSLKGIPQNDWWPLLCQSIIIDYVKVTRVSSPWYHYYAPVPMKVQDLYNSLGTISWLTILQLMSVKMQVNRKMTLAQQDTFPDFYPLVLRPLFPSLNCAQKNSGVIFLADHLLSSRIKIFLKVSFWNFTPRTSLW